MKKKLLFPALVVMYLLFSAKSCNSGEEMTDAREQNKIKTTKDSIVHNFGSEGLSEEALRAYEETARLRFADFADYYTILTDTAAARTFRIRAGEMISNIFISENSVFLISAPGGSRATEKICLKDLVDNAWAKGKNPFTLSPDSVWITQQLHQQNDSVYAGKLAFTSTKIPSAKKAVAFGNSEIFVLKREKSFGREKLNAWTVVLGETQINMTTGR